MYLQEITDNLINENQSVYIKERCIRENAEYI